ncbi:chemotaxis-specific protein-glutamate methyltransferase CheB [Anaeromyxobacter diazotrophicus]|uniref:Protein-glutamate methylesterase/protein-glutamine glutaminase n=1 Tax=Anaeromyxobacter diazotrophicus TaxID=2590199 RepID=A0A7I9VG79_9BACT|nr:chemotaxis-specific protein-glutamate methyltransferase CheB [Anaeromyxobacter diazotrophicus]GEJ55402.1 chemotaxis response regulator protein-glutamate methylesterase [Anaeromyxobacter diazotrophicus]
MSPRIRVLVAEDSLTIRKRLVEVLAQDPEIAVIAEAEDGKQAIELCERLRPDVVTLDMMMPVMTGVAAAEHIMAYCPTPILVVSASTNRGELYRTYDALAAGAIDVLDKPRGDELDGDWEARLRATVKLVARIKVITHLRGRFSGSARGRPAATPVFPSAGRPPLEVLALGGSTGSPGAVVEILRALPRGFRLPVLLVIHINEPFGKAFAEWLDAQLSVRVRYARDGERLAPGAGVLMAPPGRHLVVERGALRLDDGPERLSCKPSVDVLFESLARALGPAALGCLLTGMGKDGAEGLLAMRRAGAATVAQDEATSVVFGMPREAILLGAAERVLPLQEIGPALLEAARPGGGA